MNKLDIEKRLQELRQGEQEAAAQLYAIQGAIQELESYWLPMIEEQESDRNQDTDADGEPG